MDETSIYLDFPSNYTYERKGAKHVKSVITGGGRVRVSAAFTVTVSGIKLPILVLIPRKTPLPNFCQTIAKFLKHLQMYALFTNNQQHSINK